jgi:glycosyltransferase involved in cell wall biosynthesis
LEAWSWAANAIGAYYPLLLIGLPEARRPELEALSTEYQLGETVRLMPPLALESLAALYAGCSALFHPAALTAWADPMRLALACGKPVVGLESLHADALVGPAAYLVPQKSEASMTSRLLGAGLISVIVEESVGQTLSQAARKRASDWDIAGYTQALGDAYQKLRGD